MKCTCGLWQLGGIPCIHAVCVYQKENRDPRMFVARVFWRETFLKVYSHFLVPIGGPAFWPKTNYNPILPPEVRVLPGRPRRNRHVDPQEIIERKEKEAEEKARNAKRKKMDVQSTRYRASRAGKGIKCSYCHEMGHNKKTCDKKLGDELDNMAEEAEESTSVPARETMSQPAPARTTADGDGISSRQPPASSQPHAARRKRKTRG